VPFRRESPFSGRECRPGPPPIRSDRNSAGQSPDIDQAKRIGSARKNEHIRGGIKRSKLRAMFRAKDKNIRRRSSCKAPVRRTKRCCDSSSRGNETAIRVFLGAKHGAELASLYAAADVFVFPSRPIRLAWSISSSGLRSSGRCVSGGGPADILGAEERGDSRGTARIVRWTMILLGDYPGADGEPPCRGKEAAYYSWINAPGCSWRVSRSAGAALRAA